MTYCPQYTLTILINKKVGSQKTNEMQKKIGSMSAKKRSCGCRIQRSNLDSRNGTKTLKYKKKDRISGMLKRV